MLGENSAARTSWTRRSSASVRARHSRLAGDEFSISGLYGIRTGTVRLSIHDASASHDANLRNDRIPPSGLGNLIA